MSQGAAPAGGGVWLGRSSLARLRRDRDRDAMSIDASRPPAATKVAIPAAGITTIALQAVTVLGAAAGVQGFLSGAFSPLVDQLHDALAIVNGPVLPALALGGLVGLPHAVALVLGLRRHRRAPLAGAAVGGALAVWVAAQLPLIGLTSPVQWVFLGVGVAELAASELWRRRVSWDAQSGH